MFHFTYLKLIIGNQYLVYWAAALLEKRPFLVMFDSNLTQKMVSKENSNYITNIVGDTFMFCDYVIILFRGNEPLYYTRLSLFHINIMIC